MIVFHVGSVQLTLKCLLFIYCIASVIVFNIVSVQLTLKLHNDLQVVKTLHFFNLHKIGTCHLV